MGESVGVEDFSGEITMELDGVEAGASPPLDGTWGDSLHFHLRFRPHDIVVALSEASIASIGRAPHS